MQEFIKQKITNLIKHNNLALLTIPTYSSKINKYKKIASSINKKIWKE